MTRQKSIPNLVAQFYKTEMEAEPVRKWLLSLTQEDKKEIGENISYVQFKWPIGKPKVDHLRGAIWEVRTNLKTRIARVRLMVRL